MSTVNFTALSDSMKTVLRLLVQGQSADALAVANSTKQDLSEHWIELKVAIGKVEQEMALLEEIIEAVQAAGSWTVVATIDPTSPKRGSPAERSRRRYQILETAKMLALRTPERAITTDAIEQEIKKIGMAVPNLRTVIGNILGKNKGWTSLGRALYQYDGNHIASLPTLGFSTVKPPPSVVNTTMDADSPTSDEIDELPF